MVLKHYIIQMFSLSATASCCFGCQLVQWWWRGRGDLAGNCSLAANTVFTITSSNLAVVLKLFVVYQPKKERVGLDFILLVQNYKLIIRSSRFLRFLFIFYIVNNPRICWRKMQSTSDVEPNFLCIFKSWCLDMFRKHLKWT